MRAVVDARGVSSRRMTNGSKCHERADPARSWSRCAGGNWVWRSCASRRWGCWPARSWRVGLGRLALAGARTERRRCHRDLGRGDPVLAGPALGALVGLWCAADRPGSRPRPSIATTGSRTAPSRPSTSSAAASRRRCTRFRWPMPKQHLQGLDPRQVAPFRVPAALPYAAAALRPGPWPLALAAGVARPGQAGRAARGRARGGR